MFDDASPDYIICPVCKGNMALGLGGYYKHVTPGKCGYYRQAKSPIFVQTTKIENQKEEDEQ